MRCPGCGAELEPTAGRHGIVWLCRVCRAGAATLPILRHVAPRDFVNQVWQAALQNGVPSAQICPSCTQPFTTFTGSRARIEPPLEVCTRCYWVWLSSAALELISQPQHPIHGLQIRQTLPLRSFALDREQSGAVGAKEVLLLLAANSVLEVLG